MLYWAQDPHQSAIFFILYELGGALKHFWLTNGLFWLLLAIQNVMHMINSAVFSICTEHWCINGCYNAGGSTVMHTFGAYFGLAVSVMYNMKASDHPQNSASYYSDHIGCIHIDSR